MSKDFQDGMMLRVFKDVEAIVIKKFSTQLQAWLKCLSQFQSFLQIQEYAIRVSRLLQCYWENSLSPRLVWFAY